MTSIKKIDESTFWLYAWGEDGDIKVRSVHSSKSAARAAAAKWRRQHRYVAAR